MTISLTDPFPRVMRKMQAESLVELAHLAALAGIGPGIAAQDRLTADVTD